MTQTLTQAAEARWLQAWTTGPSEKEGQGLPIGAKAPDLTVLDHSGAPRALSEFWTDRPALIMFWRHFGCGCGRDRAARLKAEWADYLDAGLNPVVIGQGEPARAAAYRREQQLECPVLCDPLHLVYRAYGVGHWPVERILFDAPPEYWEHSHDLGVGFQHDRRAQGRPLVDDPWRAAAEFVIGTDGRVQLPYLYQYCDDFPDARVLTTAARRQRSA